MVLSCIASVVGGIASIARHNLTSGIIMLVSLVWTIPMTVYANNRLNAHDYIGTGFKICTLLFHNLIAGIILLCMKTEGEKKETNQAKPATLINASDKATSGNASTSTTEKTTTQQSSVSTKETPKNTASAQTTTPANNNTGTPHATSQSNGSDTGSSPYTTNAPTRNTSDNFHHWNYYENEFCVKMVIYNFVYHQYHDVSGVVDDIYRQLNCAIKPSSIHMKLSNIKYLLIEEDIQNTLPVKSLWQVSNDCRKAFERVYAKYLRDGEFIENPLKTPSTPEPTIGDVTTVTGPPLPTYKIKVVMNGETYFYQHNINDNNDNLIKDFGFLRATPLYQVESKIRSEKLKKQYPNANIEIVEDVSNR